MKKTTFTFPTYEALWQFKSTSNAINVSISPKQHKMTGLFAHDEVDMAVGRFGAAVFSNEITADAKKAV